ncbi:hypothetical protein SCHPADRAFT_242506 [Schizopora paradoxa]|uniref:Uncharacterized protein n=1 Tax=Schizopora paradoxa TaxID=27342 RepID=A0A0H2S2D7_9AGAM|nr:hypothetical protein SCHPADRAFT_242506 [Schizopora paradoxa]
MLEVKSLSLTSLHRPTLHPLSLANFAAARNLTLTMSNATRTPRKKSNRTIPYANPSIEEQNSNGAPNRKPKPRGVNSPATNERNKRLAPFQNVIRVSGPSGTATPARGQRRSSDATHTLRLHDGGDSLEARSAGERNGIHQRARSEPPNASTFDTSIGVPQIPAPRPVHTNQFSHPQAYLQASHNNAEGFYNQNILEPTNLNQQQYRSPAQSLVPNHYYGSSSNQDHPRGPQNYNPSEEQPDTSATAHNDQLQEFPEGFPASSSNEEAIVEEMFKLYTYFCSEESGHYNVNV